MTQYKSCHSIIWSFYVVVTMVTGLSEYFISEYNRPLEVKDHVVELTKKNFKATTEGEMTLVEFYAPW